MMDTPPIQNDYAFIMLESGQVKRMTNKDLATLVDDTIKNTGVTKMFIAKKLGVSRQQIDNILAKQNFSVDDANKLLNIIGYEIDNISIKKL